MNKLITVREYDRINKDTLFAGEGDKQLGEKNFAELKLFVEKYNEFQDKTDVFGLSRNSFDVDDVFSIFQIGTDKDGEYVKSKNYVGVIQLKNGIKIQILPKVDLDGEDDKDNKKTIGIFVKMLKSLKQFSFKVFNTADLKINDNNVYEVFIGMYLQQVLYLVKKGIKSDYNQVEENGYFYKGKLDFNKQIKHNFAHREKFYVVYDEFTENRAENRLIKTTLLKLLKLSSSEYNLRLCKQSLVYFENVDVSRDVDKDFNFVKADRNTVDYGHIMIWSKVFLKNQSFTSFEGKTGALALLFPMEFLFESYVASVVKKYFVEKYEVSCQDKGLYLLKEGEKDIFALRPDIVLTDKSGNKTRIIMDMKWKRLINDRSLKYGISQNDMYQMYAYAKEYNSSSVYVLYPKVQGFDDNANIEFINSNNNDGEIKIRIFFVNFEGDKKEPIADSINVLKRIILSVSL